MAPPEKIVCNFSVLANSLKYWKRLMSGPDNTTEDFYLAWWPPCLIRQLRWHVFLLCLGWKDWGLGWKTARTTPCCEFTGREIVNPKLCVTVIKNLCVMLVMLCSNKKIVDQLLSLTKRTVLTVSPSKRTWEKGEHVTIIMLGRYSQLMLQGSLGVNRNSGREKGGEDFYSS